MREATTQVLTYKMLNANPLTFDDWSIIIQSDGKEVIRKTKGNEIHIDEQNLSILLSAKETALLDHNATTRIMLNAYINGSKFATKISRLSVYENFDMTVVDEGYDTQVERTTINDILEISDCFSATSGNCTTIKSSLEVLPVLATDYRELTHKPSINGVILLDNVTLEQIGVLAAISNALNNYYTKRESTDLIDTAKREAIKAANKYTDDHVPEVDLSDYYTIAQVNSKLLALEKNIPTKNSQLINDSHYVVGYENAAIINIDRKDFDVLWNEHKIDPDTLYNVYNDNESGVVSPTASVVKNGSISTFTVTDEMGTTEVQILDGKDGGISYAFFEIDTTTGQLCMKFDDGYTSPRFSIDERGHLEVQLNE